MAFLRFTRHASKGLTKFFNPSDKYTIQPTYMKKSLACKFIELARSVPAKYVAVFPFTVQCLNGDVPPIPEPPVPEDVGSTLNALGEPTFASLGLNSYWPSGWYQALLETLHVNLGFPWWLAIASTTLVIRLCLFPLIIDQRRKLASYTNAMPKIMVLQDRMTKARIASDYIEMMRVSQQMQELMKTGDINPLRSMRLMVVQVPIFLSVFTGLRAMASLPVASMQTGGLAWFTDLTLCDPLYLLPLYSMTSIFLMFEFGADVSSQNMTPTIKMIMRAFPVIGFFMIMHMPSAVVWYWSVSNTISITQALILRCKPVRTYFKFPEVVPPPKAKTKKAGFVAGFRESMQNSKLLAELEARERADAERWQKAGIGSAPKTYAYDPTRQSAKKRTPLINVKGVVSPSVEAKAIK